MRKLLLLLSFIAVCAHGQINVNGTVATQATPGQNRGCGTPPLPAQFEAWLQSITPAQGKYSGGQTQSVFNIPVIVHVIHNNEAVNSATANTGNNLNALQIQDQINILNRDYNGQNADTTIIPAVFKPALGKFQFNFCLAVVNPTGGVLAEPGIDRINRNTKGWTAPPYTQTYAANTIKPNSIWDPTRYMNMWVLPMSGGILGFATFPNPGTSGLAGLSPPYGSATTDGLVMLNTAFGSVGTASTGGAYNLGRTATHEIGHWLGLRHIWGDATCGTDYCADTPPAQTANYGCPTYPHNSGVCTGNTTGEMTMNYMDYTNDACMVMFTNDQKYRAQLIMTNSTLRASLLTSTVCNLPTVSNDIALLYVNSPTYSQVINCSNSITPIVTIQNFGSNTITTATFSYNVDGSPTQTVSWSGSLLPGGSATVSLPTIGNLANGAHLFNTGVFAPNGNTDPNLGNNSNYQQFTIANSFTLAVNGPSVACMGSSVTLQASGSATSYSWNPGGIAGTVAVVSPTSNTVYTLTGATGTCVNTRTYAVSMGSPATITAASPTVCINTPVSLSASGACSYTFLPAQNLTATATTPYTVTGTCASGCPGTATGTLFVTPTPTIGMTLLPAGPLCAGGTATLTASGAVSYSWSAGQTNSVITVSPSVTTVYTVTGSVQGCQAVRTVTVSVGGSSLSIGFLPSTPTVCNGSSLTLSGTGALSYTWAGIATGSSISVSPLSNTTYTLLGANGSCTAAAMVNVTVNPSPTISVSGVPSLTVCAGQPVTLSAAGAQSYTWTGNTISPTIAITPTVAAQLSVSGAMNGCTTTKNFTVFIGGSALNLAAAASTNAVCSGGTVTLSATAVNSYTWSNGANTPTTTVSPTANTVYSVTGQNNGCFNTVALTVSVVPSPPLTINGPAIVCTGGQATLSALGQYSAFAWSPSNATGSTAIVLATAPSVFTVNATGSPSGCNNSGTIAVNVSAPPTATVHTANSLCDVCTGTAGVTASGGTPPYNYMLPGCTVPCTTLCPGLYNVTISDSAGCVTSKYFSIECAGLLTAIGESSDKIFRVYPNPADGSLHLTAPPNTKFTLTDVLGRPVIAGETTAEGSVIQIGEVAEGLYLLTCSSGGDARILKVVIEHAGH